jgi:cytochrome c5
MWASPRGEITSAPQAACTVRAARGTDNKSTRGVQFMGGSRPCAPGISSGSASGLKVILAGIALLLAGCGQGDGERRAQTGEQVYQRFCFACHAGGAAGAPRVGRPDEWRERIDRGRDEMLRNTIAGMQGMPPRGGCTACSDEELEAAIDFMLQRTL